MSFLRIGVVFLGLDFRRWSFFVVFSVFVPFVFFSEGFGLVPLLYVFPLF